MIRSEDYTAHCEQLARQADAKLAELSKLMKDNGDGVRAMDVDEARTYLEGAVSYE